MAAKLDWVEVEHLRLFEELKVFEFTTECIGGEYKKRKEKEVFFFGIILVGRSGGAEDVSQS